MISTKKIIQMTRKWQKQAINRRKRLPRRITTTQQGCRPPVRAEKGHFVVYSTDKRRFVLPLLYLNHKIFRELLKLAEDEFGLSTNAPLTLPFEATVIEYVIMLIQRKVTKGLEEAVLISIASGRSQSSYRQPTNHQHLIL